MTSNSKSPSRSYNEEIKKKLHLKMLLGTGHYLSTGEGDEGRNFEILPCQRCDFMHSDGWGRGGGGWGSVTENELLIIVKLDVASSAVSPF